ncbi:MAG: PAS domain S-box protein [Bacteroidetes bacterium]|nr:PAS domain S-box protein [Bacteroidota bacterium]
MPLTRSKKLKKFDRMPSDSKIDTKQIIDYLVEIAKGKLSITENTIIEEEREDLKVIYAGLLHLSEDLQYHLSKIEDENRQAQASSREILQAITSIAQLDFESRLEIPKEYSVFAGIGMGLNMLSEELQSSAISRDYLENVFSSMLDMLVVVDSKSFIQTTNQSLLDTLGYQEKELLGKPFSTITGEVNLIEQKGNEDSIEHGVTKNIDINYITKERIRIPVLFSSSVMLDAKNKIEGIVCVAIDIMERKKLADKALRVSEEKFRTLFEDCKDAIYISTTQGKFTDANGAALDLFGYSKKEFLNIKLYDLFVHPNDRKDYQQEMGKSGFVRDFEVDLHKKDRTEISCLITSSARSSDEDNDLGCQGIIRDISVRKLMEEELKSSQRELRFLYRNLQNLREKESKSIAREIHDELGQILTSLKVDLSLFNEQKEYSSERRISMLKLVDSAIQSVRRISSNLRPATLDDLGLSSAIEAHVQDFRKLTKIECELSLLPDQISFDNEKETSIYRIIQESLTNITRHARATKVSISLMKVADNLVLKIKDNGVGITKNQSSYLKSFGLLGMKERVLQLNGNIDINGIAGQGTTIAVEIPLSSINKSVSA